MSPRLKVGDLEVSNDQPPAQFLAILELFKAHVGAIVTLATGALVLSTTFLKDVKLNTLQSVYWLKSSWVLFTLTILAGVLYSYVLTLLGNSTTCWNKNSCGHRTLLGVLSLPLHLLFILAVCCFLGFAWGIV
jgi:hypothetical protein